MNSIKRKYIDWKKTGTRLRNLRNHNLELRRFVCKSLNYNKGECSGECKACVTACPAGAISGKAPCGEMKREEFFDAQLCSEYMKNFKDIGRGSVCGLCIKACPKNNLK